MEEENNKNLEETEYNEEQHAKKEEIQNLEIKISDNEVPKLEPNTKNYQNNNFNLEPKDRNNALVLILSILVLILAIIIGYLILTSKNKEKTVINEAPILTLIGKSEITLTEGEQYIEEGYQANDSKDGDITGNVKVEGTVDTKKAGFYTILYSVTDSDLASTSTTRKVTVVSKEASTLTLTLKGEEIETIKQGALYVDSGYEAKDIKDGDITSNVKITGEVNTEIAGNYILTYTVENSSKEVALVKRTIVVTESMKELSINSELVKNLYNNISDDVNDLNNYQSKKVTYKELSNKSLLTIAFYSCSDGEDMTIDDVIKCLKKIYDISSINIPITTTISFGGGAEVAYDNEAKVWRWGNKGKLVKETTLLTSAIQDGDYIYLYDKYQLYKATELNIEQSGESGFCEKDGVINNIYADSDLKTKIGETYCYPIFDEQSNWLNSSSVNRYYENINVPYYKHTFKKNTDGEYYFVSTEPVK